MFCHQHVCVSDGISPFTTNLVFSGYLNEDGAVVVRNQAEAWLVPFFYPSTRWYFNAEGGKELIDVSVAGKVLRWQQLLASGYKLRRATVVFDLEWNQHIHELRFIAGKIIDRHFEILEYPLVVSTGYVHCDEPLTNFLCNQGYTLDLLNTQGTTWRKMVDELLVVEDGIDQYLYTSYNGRNSDVLVLQSCGVVLDHFLDATLACCPGRMTSQVKLYRRLFDQDPPNVHWAAADTQSLIRILHVQDGARVLWDLYQTYTRSAIATV